MQTNVYRALLDILPQTPLQVATATATHADGTTTITHPGGAQQRVRGQATPGTKVFIQSGQIQGPAPSLTTLTIDI